MRLRGKAIYKNREPDPGRNKSWEKSL